MLTSAMVRMAKGAAASILLLLMTERQGGNQEWIERYTGYTDKPVSQALAFLLELGFITKSGERGDFVYQLAIGVTQLPLPMEKIEESATGDTEEDEKRIEGDGEEKIESESFRLDALASSSSLILNQESRDDLLQQDSRAIESEKFRFEALLDRHGVRNPARKRLLAANPGGAGTRYAYDLVQAHLVLSENVGQAIYRIEHDWPVDRDKWRNWLSIHCPDCEQYHGSCTCDWEDEPTDDG